MYCSGVPEVPMHKLGNWLMELCVLLIQCQNQVGVLLAVTAWCITEVIRYCFYVQALVGDVFYILQWTRYVYCPYYLAAVVVAADANFPHFGTERICQTLQIWSKDTFVCRDCDASATFVSYCTVY